MDEISSGSQILKVNYAKVLSHYLKRARHQLGLFDAGEHHALFYAALELRMGIEMRLHEGIKSALRKSDQKRNSDRPIKITEHKIRKLLRSLSEHDPNADEPATIAITIVREPELTIRASYIPISRELANAAERLGDLLHFGVFDSHPRFFSFRVSDRSKPREWTIVDYRSWLGEVADQLQRVSDGGLVSHPKWNALVHRVFDVEESQNGQTGERMIEARVKDSLPKGPADSTNPAASSNRGNRST